MPRVFISHSHHDNVFCRAFVVTLDSLGVETWYDEQSLGVGVIRKNIEEVIPNCDYFVVILTPSSVRSEWVKRELDAALELEGKGKLGILPVVAEPCDVPLLLSGYKRVEGISTPVEAAQLAHTMLFAGKSAGSALQYQVKVVTSSQDPDLDQFFALYKTLFPLRQERSSSDDMMRYIEESQVEKVKKRPDYLEELVLVKSRDRVVAFLNYTFYYSSRYVFISYIGNVAPESARTAVMSALLGYFKQTMLDQGCLAAVFEVESKRIKPDGEPARIRLFRKYLRAYAQLENTNCFEILFNFIQPHLLIDDVKEEPGRLAELFTRVGLSPSKLHDLGVPNMLTLGLIPLRPDFVHGTHISRALLLSVLKFVYGQVYADSFTDDEADNRKYKAYMNRLIRYYAYTLPKEIKLRAQGTAYSA